MRGYKIWAFVLLLIALDGLFTIHVRTVSLFGSKLAKTGGAVGAILGGGLQSYSYNFV